MTWQPSPGQTAVGPGLLLTNVTDGRYLFQPQAAIGGEFGGIAVTYYLFDAASGKIDVYVTATLVAGGGWQTVKLTQKPWDPGIDMIQQHGEDWQRLTFVGDYFGLASCNRGYFPLWMDTRTGIAEMFTTRVDFHRTIVSSSGNGAPPFLHL